jgi:AcrR family transcriptional regulator
MAQIKKEKTRNAILAAAYRLFMKHGYHRTTLRQIAKVAGVSLSNIYVYFNSKYQIVFELYDPWMKERIEQMTAEALAIADKRARLRHIILTLWREILAAQNGFARNIMQALPAVAGAGYDPKMIDWIERRLTTLISGCLLPDHRGSCSCNVPHVLMMVSDGFRSIRG